MPRSKFPKQDPNFDWISNQAPRHEAARQFYGGASTDETAGTAADHLLNPLYTSQSAKEAVEYAVRAQEGGGGGEPSSQQAQGDGSGDKQQEDWLEREGKGITHMQANLLQARLGGQLMTRFQPFRHTVIIAGRPMQAEWPEPNIQPPAMRFDHMLL